MTSFDREEYERVPSDDVDSAYTRQHNVLRLLKKLAWIAIGAFTVFKSDLYKYILNWKTDLDLVSFYFLAASVTVSILCIIYLLFYIKPKHGPMALKRWRTFAPGAVQTFTGANLLAFVAAARLFYPIYGKWTLPLVTILCWSWLNILTFI